MNKLKEELEQVGAQAFTVHNYRPGIIRHIVLFRFAYHVTPSERNVGIKRLLGLQEACLREGKPYILSIETGTQSSGDGAHAGFEQAFLITFASEGDRNFYTGEPVVTDPSYYDPIHHAFKSFIRPMLAGAFVFDYAVSLIDDESYSESHKDLDAKTSRRQYKQYGKAKATKYKFLCDSL